MNVTFSARLSEVDVQKVPSDGYWLFLKILLHFPRNLQAQEVSVDCHSFGILGKLNHCESCCGCGSMKRCFSRPQPNSSGNRCASNHLPR
jgi:hypothetical protein